MRAHLQSIDMDAVRETVRAWCRLLASKDYSAAAQFLAQVPGRNIDFSAENLKAALGRYSRAYREAGGSSSDELIPNVTTPEKIDLTDENLILYSKSHQGKALVEYDLPIDGKWSDLTAKFLILPADDGYCLALIDLRVL